MTEANPVEFWEQLYTERSQIWTGRVNATLADLVGSLDVAPARALELGCGEGGDAVWLAQQGWTVTAVDLSPTAVSRGRAAAQELGLSAQVRFVAQDLTTWHPETAYDLVTASFFQAPVELARTEILRRAASSLAPGGRLVLVSHAGPPSWALEHAGDHRFLTPAQELEQLALGDGWEVETAELRRRSVVGPDEQEGFLDDSVVVIRRA